MLKATPPDGTRKMAQELLRLAAQQLSAKKQIKELIRDGMGKSRKIYKSATVKLCRSGKEQHQVQNVRMIQHLSTQSVRNLFP